MQGKVLRVFVFLCFLLLPLQTVFAAPNSDTSNKDVTIDFPNTITFQTTLQSTSNITSVTLEYGTQQLTCGEVIAKGFPQFTPGKSVNVSWTWDMRQSGSLPPGTNIWWRWRYQDSAGNESVTEQQSVIWLDNAHQWQTISEGKLNLHWYSGGQAFAQDLLNSAVSGLARLEHDTGLAPDQPIDLYIYANTNDMQQAILYEPSWTGGEAFPEQNIVIIGISQADLAWGRRAEVHELTHVLVGHLTFSCLGSVPTWLNEGLAVYSEGPLDSASQSQLDDAIQNNKLLSVQSLSSGFSEVPSKAYLSYSESFSIVNFLIKTYGQQQMTSLLIALRDGTSVDDALQKVYRFNVDGLEDAWRASIHAQPRAASAQATAQPTPTFVPTIVPVSGAQLLTTPTPFAVSTSSTSNNTPASPTTSSGPPLALTLGLLAFCCVFGLLIGVIILGAIASRERLKGSKHE